ncbi:MAG: hypothetical protein RL196_312 [Actinomycetota bacterium]|jgi:hypothetical protein
MSGKIMTFKTFRNLDSFACKGYYLISRAIDESCGGMLATSAALVQSNNRLERLFSFKVQPCTFCI